MVIYNICIKIHFKSIKKQLAYVAAIYDEWKRADTSSDVEKCYELPDGQILAIGAERFRCAELLFQPDQLN